MECLSEENVVEIGRIAHFFAKISVAVIELTAPLAVGDTIVVKGPTTDFKQVVESMQIEHNNVQRAVAGQSIGLKVVERVREKDTVYKKI
jgi:translation elongation factor EF-1alpha